MGTVELSVASGAVSITAKYVVVERSGASNYVGRRAEFCRWCSD